MNSPSQDLTQITGSARVRLGHTELSVRPIGLGCMGMSQSYGPADDDESTRTIRAGLDLGVNLLDTSDVYGASDATYGVPIRGFGHNEQLIGAAIAGRRHEVVLATKFSAQLNDRGDGIVIDGRPDYVKSACDASLRRLNTDVIDLYYYHRLDLKVPIEDTVGAMSDLVAAGKVRALGLSEVEADQIRRAHAVHPITALQSEYSLWERGLEKSILGACRELGITVVAYSPLGRSALTGALSGGATFVRGDLRATNPRFSTENLRVNLEPVEILKELAEQKDCTPAQLALAWLLSRPLDVVPIPGTKRVRYLQENAAATNIALSADEAAVLERAFAPERIIGDRYAPVHARNIPTAPEG